MSTTEEPAGDAPPPDLEAPPTETPPAVAMRTVHYTRVTPAYLWALAFRTTPSSVKANPNTVFSLEGREGDFKLIIEEGRRQLDSQRSELESIRGRAQTLFTVTLVVLAFNASVFNRASEARGWRLDVIPYVWSLAFWLIGLGLFMAAAVTAVAGRFAAPDTTQLTDSSIYPPPFEQSLAEDFADSVRQGAMTVTDRVNALQIATRYVLLGALLTAATYLLAS